MTASESGDCYRREQWRARVKTAAEESDGVGILHGDSVEVAKERPGSNR